MERDPKYFIIGLVVLCLTVGVSLFLLWSSKVGTQNNSIVYHIFLKEQSPSGLQKDGLITLKGLKVGSIKSIGFNPKNVEQVIVEALIDADAPIKTDTRAIVRSNFVTGLAFIDLIDSSKKAEFLRDTGSDRFIIPEGKTSLEEIQNTIPDIVENVNKVMQRAESFLSKDNAVAFSRIVSSTDTITQSLADKSDSIVKSFEESAQEFVALTAELKQAVQSIQVQTKQLSIDSRQLVRKATHKLEQTGNSVTEMAQSIKQGKESLLGPTEQNLLDD
ncbi:MAG: MCE family protein [Bdellovibrionales bacterium]|nr:MCE family protein [Bdellovibrionales bacterium]